MFAAFLNWWQMKTLRIKLMWAFGIYLILMAVVVIYSISRNKEAVDEVAMEASANVSPVSEVVESELVELEELAFGPNERAILEGHFKALGGVQRLSSIKSIRASGKAVYPDGRELRFIVTKKQGGMMRLTLNSEQGQVVTAISPDDNWRALYRGGLLYAVEDLDGDDLLQMQRTSYLVSELYLATLNDWDIRYLGEQAFNYEMAYTFEVKVSDREQLRFFIDPDSMLDVGREDWIFDEDGTLTLTRMVGSDHWDVNGLRVPGQIETYENNVLMQTFILEDFELNAGILGSSFRRPEEEPLIQLRNPVAEDPLPNNADPTP